MSQLSDVVRVLGEVEQFRAIHGAAPEFLTEYGQKVEALGQAIRDENGGVSREEAVRLSKETPLRSTSEPLFTDLKRWLGEKDNRFRFA